MSAGCGFVIVLSILCVSSAKGDAVGNVCSDGTCPSSFVQSKKMETKIQDVLFNTEKSDQEEQASQDGEMGMMDTENMNQMKEDQTSNESEMGEMGTFQDRKFWWVRRRRSHCENGSNCDNKPSGR